MGTEATNAVKEGRAVAEGGGRRDIPQLIPLAKWARYFEDPTIGSMRWMVWRAEHYGIAHCIKRVGRRIWIDQEAFWAWLGAQGGEEGR